jgi:hypothetical protein
VALNAPFTVPSATQSVGIGFRASTTANNGSTATSIAINKPAGTASGDVLLAGLYVRGQGSTASATAPAGWTLIRRTDLGNPVGGLGSVLSYYKVAGGAEPTSYSWSFDSSRRALGGIAAYTGVNTTTPVDASAGQGNSISSTAVTAPSITTSVGNTMVVGLFGLFDFATFTPASGMTERWDFTVNNPAGMAFAATTELRSATGATGGRTVTSSFADTSIGQLIALRPAGGTPVNTPPTVSLTAPANNATFTAPANITINADATDSDGVSKVEFFQGTTKLGEDLTAPYSYVWGNVAAGSYSLTAKATDNTAATTTSAPVNITVSAPGATTATFVRIDTTRQGSWQGVYGGDGYHIINDAVNYPAYASVTPSGHSVWTWEALTTDVRGLQKASGSERIAATWYAATSFTVDVALTDGQTHEVALYCVDWDQGGRGQRVEIVDAATNAVLDSRDLTGFTQGQYLVWNLKGNVRIRVVRTGGPNAVVSGLFFNPQGN